MFAQTEVEQMGLPGAPDKKQLLEKAEKAIEKDDKKKMGTDKFNTFMKIKKYLSGKNDKSRSLAGVLEKLLEGQPVRGLDFITGEETAADKEADKTKIADTISEIKDKLKDTN